MSDDINAALREVHAHLDAIAGLQRAMLQELHLTGALRMQDVANRMTASTELFRPTEQQPENENLSLAKTKIFALGEALDQYEHAQASKTAAAE